MSRRDLRNEAEHLPESVEDAAVLYDRLIEAGHSPSVALAISGWTTIKATGRPDPTNSATRARYRKILAELEPIDAPPPDRPERRLEVVDGAGKGPRKRARGTRKLASVVALALVSAGAGTQGRAPRADAAQLDRTDVTWILGGRRRRARKAA